MHFQPRRRGTCTVPDASTSKIAMERKPGGPCPGAENGPGQHPGKERMNSRSWQAAGNRFRVSWARRAETGNAAQTTRCDGRRKNPGAPPERPFSGSLSEESAAGRRTGQERGGIAYGRRNPDEPALHRGFGIRTGGRKPQSRVRQENRSRRSRRRKTRFGRGLVLFGEGVGRGQQIGRRKIGLPHGDAGRENNTESQQAEPGQWLESRRQERHPEGKAFHLFANPAQVAVT